MKLTWPKFLCTVLMAAVPFAARAETATQKNSAEQELATRVRAVDVRGPAGVPLSKPVTAESWHHVASRLSSLANAPEPAQDCPDAKYVRFAGKYMISMDGKTGQACKLYDLSFPTLKAFGQLLVFSGLPTQKYTAKDYLNWINGEEAAVAAKMQAFSSASHVASSVASSVALTSIGSDSADWINDIEFRSEFRDTPALAYKMQASRFGARQLPKSFRASDLQIGTRFQFSAPERENLKKVVALLRTTGTPEATVQTWTEAIDQPESFLSKIRFDWNDAKKIYDIALETDFVPLSGPVALVDFKSPHKPAVERLVRSVVGSALRSLAFLIPQRTVQNVVVVAIDDSFEFLEMMYAYQYNQLEDTLRASMSGKMKTTFPMGDMQSMLNLMFSAQSDFMSQYVITVAQGQKFDWNAVEKIGKRARYGLEKTRDVTMSEMNSRLALKKKCEMQITNGYFGICSRAGKKVALHSLVSKTSVLFWNLGAPKIHNYSAPAEVPLKRGIAYLLSVGARVMNLGIGYTISQNLSGALKSFAFSGMMDEALLRNQLWIDKQNGLPMDAETTRLFAVLYKQNLNPFLPHSESTEEKYIQINSQTLEPK
ncbi:MAG: hypothetical protein NDI61_13350 [Bdellovibrionaceae bacterium]|nr:hypothetical protein [Pseudobdellovibrionaceae bacterium]